MDKPANGRDGLTLTAVLITLVTFLAVASTSAAVCDVDGDFDVDRTDIDLILGARNQPASGAFDPRDADGDGVITALDARKCVLVCSLPRCAVNLAPIADAGLDQNVFVGSAVTLDGSASRDPDNGPTLLAYLWRFVSVPPGSALTDAELAGPGSPAPSFTPDLAGVYVLTLTVSDGAASASAEVEVSAAVENVAPNADAGPDQNVIVGAPVHLNGSASSDPDNGPNALSYSWSFVSVPSGSLVTDADLSDSTAAMPSFASDVEGSYLLDLEVSDGLATAHDQVEVTASIDNVAPNANAGPDQSDAIVGTSVELDGVQSVDPDNYPSPLSFQWIFVSVASGSALVDADIVNASTATPSFTPDRDGTYVVKLIVSDGDLTDEDQVMVTAAATNTAPVAENDDFVTDEDMTLVDDVLSNDTDAESDPLTAVLNSDVSHGSLAFSSSGTFTYAPDPDFFGTDGFSYMANDGVLDSSPAHVVITVRPINDAPTLDPIGDVDVLEDSGPQLVSLTGISAGPNEVQFLTVTATSDNPTLVLNPAVSYSSPDAVGSLTFTPVEDQYGSALLTVRVRDDGGIAANGIDTFIRTFTVTVEPVNDAPTLDPLGDLTIDEDAGPQVLDLTGISTGAANETQHLTVTATSSNVLLIPSPTVGYTSPDASGSLAFTSVADGFGSATITVTVHDDGGTANGGVDTFVGSFTITVSPVNDAPTLDPIAGVTVGEDSGLHAIPLTGITSGAANESQVLDVTATSSNPALVPDPAVEYTSPDGSGTLTFAPASGENGNAVITVSVHDDGGTAKGGVDTLSRTFTITVTPALPSVTLVPSDPDAAEPGFDSATFTVSRAGSTTNPLTVSFTIAGTAIEGLDYEAIGTSVTIPAGSASDAVTVTPIDDSLFESPETVVLTLAAQPSYTLGVPATATVRILDDELPVVTITAADSASEAGPVVGTFTVSRTGPTTDPLTVLYAITGSATNGVDFQTIGTSVTIPAGSVTGSVTITPIDDGLVEGAESVVITLEPNAAYELDVPAIAAMNIADDDISAVTVNADDPDATEAGPTTGRFTFMRTGNTTAALDILVAGGGTATNGLDYAGAVGANFIVTFPAGAASTTLTITPLADNLAEGPETVVVSIQPNLRYVVGAPNAATVTIADDPVTVNVIAVDSDAAEAGRDPGVFAFSRQGGNLAAALSVVYTRAGTATNASDFAFIGNSVTIPANQLSGTLTITPLADNVVESTETVIVTIASSSSYVIGTPDTATVTLADDPAVVTVTASDPDASETGPDPGTFTFSRIGGNLAAALTVLATRSGTASNGIDYVSFGSIVTFPANQTSISVTVVPVDDAVVEPSETVVITLSPSGSYAVGVPSSGSVTIVDNDSSAVPN